MRSPDKSAASRPASAESAAPPTKARETAKAAARAAEAAKAARAAETGDASRPPMLVLAAAVLAVEAAGLAVAGVLAAVDAGSGRSSQASSGVALTILAFLVVAWLVWIAAGVARVRPWSRTPAVMTQGFTGVVAIYLLQAHRYDWGIPALLLALAGLAGLLAPASFRALTRQVKR